MEPLLFLCHRLPYPPNKGDKIRSFHLLKHLSTRYKIYLGTFIDDPVDRQYVPTVASYCEQLLALTITPRLRRVASLRGLLSGEALGLPYYRDARMREWVAQIWQQVQPRKVLVYSSTMAQYIEGARYATARRVVDFVDVDSEKWRAYAAEQRWPMAWSYGREARLLRRYEQRIAAEVDASVFVSAAEAQVFRDFAGVAPETIHAADNGVDSEYFAPDPNLPNPYPRAAPVVVFTGAMDYWANVDAVSWFARDILPLVHAQMPTVEFWIVGARPTPAVRQLAGLAQVSVTGSVADIRPYLQHAALAVAPLRIARGVQNKVLEALAMGKTVVGTPAAFEGLAPATPCREWAADDPVLLAARVVAALRGNVPVDHAQSARRYVLAQHHWTTNMQSLAALLEAA